LVEDGVAVPEILDAADLPGLAKRQVQGEEPCGTIGQLINCPIAIAKPPQENPIYVNLRTMQAWAKLTTI
jgi:hypothetical protein